jgi:hypothetical protein
VPRELPAPRDPQDRSPECYQRQKSRERIKLIGLRVLGLLILLIAFGRFGKTIPWGGR